MIRGLAAEFNRRFGPEVSGLILRSDPRPGRGFETAVSHLMHLLSRVVFCGLLGGFETAE